MLRLRSTENMKKNGLRKKTWKNMILGQQNMKKHGLLVTYWFYNNFSSSIYSFRFFARLK